MITKQPAIQKLDKISLLFGLLALVTGGVVALIVIGVSKQIYLTIIIGGILGGMGLLLRPQLGLKLLLHPEWCLLFLVFMLYTRLSDLLIRFHGAPSLTQPYIMLLIFVVTARRLLFNKPLQGWEGIAPFIVTYGLLTVSSILYASDPTLIPPLIEDFIKDAIIVVCITILLNRKETLRQVILVLLVVGIFIGAINVYQQLTETFDNNYWGFAQASKMSIDDDGKNNDFRIGGPFSQPNSFAQFMLVLVPLAFDRVWRERNLIWRLFAILALGATVLTVLYTFSRGAFLGMVLTLLIMFISLRPSLLATLTTLLVTSILLTFTPAQYTARMETLLYFLPGSTKQVEEEASFRGRLSENTASWMMFVDHPILGVGLNNYNANYPRYGREIGLDSVWLEEHQPHNAYLEIAAEFGLLGLTWWFLLAWVLFKNLYQARKIFLSINMPDYASLVLALTLGIGSLYLTGIFLHLAHFRFFWILWAIAFAASNIAKQEAEKVGHDQGLYVKP